VRRGILGSADDIACIDTHFQRYTYPIPTVGLDDVKAYLTEFLAAKGIYLVGRNGAWEYLNIDGVFASAARFVAALPHRG
jgi:UDP-galactopyranose mutase